MARSRRRPYYKDKRMTTQEYWQRIRSNWKQNLRVNYMDPDLNFESPKSIVNDYDYSDYWFFVEDKSSDGANKFWNWGWTKEDVERYSRK